MEIKVTHNDYDHVNRLTLMMHCENITDNRLFIELTRVKGTTTKVAFCADTKKGSRDNYTVDLRTTNFIQDAIRDTIDNPSTSKRARLGDNHFIDILHFPNGEIGMQIGNYRYKLPKADVQRLRQWSAISFY